MGGGLVPAVAVPVLWAARRAWRMRLEVEDDDLVVQNWVRTRRFPLGPGTSVVEGPVHLLRSSSPGLWVTSDGRRCPVAASVPLSPAGRVELAGRLARVAAGTGCRVGNLTAWTGDTKMRRRTIGGPGEQRRRR